MSSTPSAQHLNPNGDMMDVDQRPLEHQAYQQQHYSRPDEETRSDLLHPQGQQKAGSLPPSVPNKPQSASPTVNGSADASADRAASQGSQSRATTTGTAAPFEAGTRFDPLSNVHRPKMNKSNKIYVGNLPPTTREDDLLGCFGEMGRIVAVELKVGYGFVEFENREQAEKAVQKYDGGLFLGNKIRCEVSHGAGKATKIGADPGACFKCRQPGHWARECPNEAVDPNWRDDYRPPWKRQRGPVHKEDLTQQPMGRGPPAGYRDEFPNERPARLPSRDYHADPLAARDMRDYKGVREARPASPPLGLARLPYPRDYDDYRGAPPPRGPPGPPPPAAGPYDSRGPPPDSRAYDMRAPYDARPPMYDRPEYDRPPPMSRGGDYGPSSAPPLSAGGYDRPTGPYSGSAPYGNGRTRSPPGGFDARRDYGPPSAAAYDAYRGRPAPGPPAPQGGRYDAYSRRRSMSPPARSGGGYYDAPSSGPPVGYGGGYGRSQADYPPAGYYDAPPPGSGYRGGPPPVGLRDDVPDRRYADARIGGGYDRR